MKQIFLSFLRALRVLRGKIRIAGILEEATVDLSKDLIILTGENNTGKTYLAYTIYHLLNINYGELPDTLTREKSSKNITGTQNKEFISQSIGNHLKQTLNELFAFDSNTAESSFKDVQIHIDIPGKIKAETIDVSETGFEIETIDEVVKALNESSQDIYFTLFD